ncbi:hypothetical protein bcere0029_57790 [Bacillus cereus AH1272]|nr:hypothetical protein bcere0029_57790 [Bacillus cereus AH1272]EEL92792.1 hypothetical protein bcere0030_31610 [Bacillus cereus AH1273]
MRDKTFYFKGGYFMKRFLNTLLQFVVLSIALHLLFDIVGWLVFNAPIKNKQIIISLLTTSWLMYMYRDKFFKAFTSN